MAPTSVPETMKAAVMPEPERLVVQTVPVPRLEGDDVLIRVRACGICGTDLHLYHGHTRNPVYPLIMGHELAGEIAAVGPDAAEVPIGARVVAEGRAGTGFRRAGAYAEYVSVPKTMLHYLAPEVDFIEAALVDPLACAVNAVNQAGSLPAGSKVVVIGQGSSGLCMTQAVQALRGCQVAAVDHHDERLALSRQFGAVLTVNPKEADAAAAIAEWTEGKGADCVLEATGRESAVDLATQIVRRGGTVVVYGVFSGPITFDIRRLMYNQLKMVGATGSPGCYPTAVELLERHQVDLRSIVTRVMPLDALPEAFDLLERHREVVKVVIAP